MKKTMTSMGVLAVLALALPVLAQAQCDDRQVRRQASNFSSEVGPTTNFGSVPVGSSKTIVIGGTNSSPVAMTVFVALSGPEAGDFSVINPCSEGPIGPRASCFGSVTFMPRSAGPKNAELLLVLRGLTPPEVNPPATCTGGTNTPPPESQNPALDENGFVRMETWPLTGVGR